MLQETAERVVRLLQMLGYERTEGLHNHLSGSDFDCLRNNNKRVMIVRADDEVRAHFADYYALDHQGTTIHFIEDDVASIISKIQWAETCTFS